MSVGHRHYGAIQRANARGAQTDIFDRSDAVSKPADIADRHGTVADHDRNGGSLDVFTAPFEGDPAHSQLGKAELFVGTQFNEKDPAFSPDGKWLAYASSESGNFEVYVRPFPGPGGRWQISTGGGNYPLWSRDGRELLFETRNQRVMAVSCTAKGDPFTPASLGCGRRFGC